MADDIHLYVVSKVNNHDVLTGVKLPLNVKGRTQI
jgi:hypothetical protein